MVWAGLGRPNLHRYLAEFDSHYNERVALGIGESGPMTGSSSKAQLKRFKEAKARCLWHSP